MRSDNLSISCDSFKCSGYSRSIDLELEGCDYENVFKQIVGKMDEEDMLEQINPSMDYFLDKFTYAEIIQALDIDKVKDFFGIE